MDPTAQRRFFDEEGYLIVRGLLAPDLVAEVRDALLAHAREQKPGAQRLVRTRQDGSELVWMKDLHRRIPAVAGILRHPDLCGLVARLLGDTPELRLSHDTLFLKEPGHGGPVGFHQDYSYWEHARPADMVAAFVALTPSTRETGCLHVLPGSHRWGLLPSSWTDHLTEDPEAFLRHPRVAAERAGAPPAVAVELQPGDVSLHHCLTVHGSYRNTGDTPRLAYVVHFFPDRVRYDASRVRFWQADPALRDGEPFCGPNHPVLWHRAVA